MLMPAQHDHHEEMHARAFEVCPRADEAVADGVRAAEGAYAVAPQPRQEIGALGGDGVGDEELGILEGLHGRMHREG